MIPTWTAFSDSYVRINQSRHIEYPDIDTVMIIQQRKDERWGSRPIVLYAILDG